MENKKIYFYEGNTAVYLDVFLCNKGNEYSITKRPMILICPGGAYAYCSAREAEPIARAYMARGYNTAILYYTCKVNADTLYDSENDVAKPHLEAAKSICIIRDNAEEWSVDPDKIAVIGFSAGGHLAGCTSILWNDEKLVKALGCPEGYNKPNASILCYPVVTMGEYAHAGSRDNLLGDYKTEENLARYSLEKQVTDTCPTFIVHASNDPGVSVHNAIDLTSALVKAGVSCEVHIIPQGGHGFSLAEREVLPHPNRYVSRWLGWSIDWLETIFDF